jgi:hypothetical protein
MNSYLSKLFYVTENWTEREGNRASARGRWASSFFFSVCVCPRASTGTVLVHNIVL